MHILHESPALRTRGTISTAPLRCSDFTQTALSYAARTHFSKKEIDN
jgi:hypothetical protein